MGKYTASLNDILVVWASSNCKSKWKRKFKKLGKVYGRVEVLQPIRSKNKKQKEIETWIEKE